MFVVAFSMTVGCAPTSHTHSVPITSSTLPSWFPGVWTREWIERKGVRTDLFDIHFLQTPSLFGDVRIPRDRPSLAHAHSFADLTDAELLLLAKQRAFAGTTTIDGALATWHHEIDFQPSDSSADIGRLERIDDGHMLEHATDSSYVEAWRSLDNGAGRFLALRVDRAGRLDLLLLIVGDHFVYARNRSADLPQAESLDSLIAVTHATRSQIISYLDCEFSTGLVRGGTMPWAIQQSTLPWREGKRLDFAAAIVVDDAGNLAPRVGTAEHWTTPVNTLTLAERRALFARRQ
jgi:hypothetical protein